MAQASTRSMMAPWIGGASTSVVQAGYRGFMIYWIGGAQAPGTTPPPTGHNKDIYYVAGGHHPACHAGSSVIKIGGVI